MLYIRADGNTEIGMGHVMRCLSVAEAANINGLCPPVFITADRGCCSMIEERGFRVIVLDTDYRDMMCEIPLLTEYFQKEPDIAHAVVLVDSYQAGSAYYLELRKFVKVACFEDMGEAYPVDLLINYNIYAQDLKQNYSISRQHPQKVLLGARYMPLRRAFQEPSEYQVHTSVTDVMITTGGSDPYFAAAAIADTLIKDKTVKQGIHLHLISGPFNQFADELKHRYQTCAAVTIHENVKDMRSLLLKSDVVITATGSTIYEISSLGVPMIVFYFAENQRQGAEALEKRTDIVNAGCFADDPQAVADKIKGALKLCMRDQAYRECLSRQEKGLIDGKGAYRIVEQIFELASENKNERESRQAYGIRK